MTDPRPSDAAVHLRHDEAHHRYVAVIDEEVVSFADHRDAGDGVWSFPHTVTEPEFGGRGLAAQVVAFAMADVRERGLKVVPACSYVAHWFDEHPDQQDLLA